MSKKVKLLGIKEDEEDQDLRDLLEKYIKKSEELEKRESRVLKQVELVQSAVASLQAWNQNRRISETTSETVNVDVKGIEEETKMIKEETDRIQKEVRQKIEENKMLQDEVNRRKGIGVKTDKFEKLMNEEVVVRAQREEIETRANTESELSEQDSDPGIQFFNEKLKKLREMEKKLKRESELELEESMKQKKNIVEKIEWPKWRSQADEDLVNTWKEKILKN